MLSDAGAIVASSNADAAALAATILDHGPRSGHAAAGGPHADMTCAQATSRPAMRCIGRYGSGLRPAGHAAPAAIRGSAPDEDPGLTARHGGAGRRRSAA